jgi:uncharacterized protein YbaA (DUF1428 family)
MQSMWNDPKLIEPPPAGYPELQAKAARVLEQYGATDLPECIGVAS